MRTYYLFQSEKMKQLRGFAGDLEKHELPIDCGPWQFLQQVGPYDEWTFGIRKSVVAAGVLENGYCLWGQTDQPKQFHPVIESDRVEGTPVYDGDGDRIGTIKRLLIEKMSGNVLFVDITFGGFLGMGVHHRTIPWDNLKYDTELGGYRTNMSEGQVQSAPAFHGDGEIGPDHNRHQELRSHKHEDSRGSV